MNAQPVNSTLFNQVSRERMPLPHPCPSTSAQLLTFCARQAKKGLSGARDENISWPLGAPKYKDLPATSPFCFANHFLRMKVAVQYPQHHNGLLTTKEAGIRYRNANFL